MAFDTSVHPHRRCEYFHSKIYQCSTSQSLVNPLTNEYILVSPHRTKRPWLGQVEAPQTTRLSKYDEACYLCPGNARTSGQRNAMYENTYTFENDFAAIPLAPAPEAPIPSHPLMISEPVHGACDVLIFHPRHDLSMARLDLDDIEHIIEEWIKIYNTRGAQPGIQYIQIFEASLCFTKAATSDSVDLYLEQRFHYGLLKSTPSWTSLVSVSGTFHSSARIAIADAICTLNWPLF